MGVNYAAHLKKSITNFPDFHNFYKFLSPLNSRLHPILGSDRPVFTRVLKDGERLRFFPAREGQQTIAGVLGMTRPLRRRTFAAYDHRIRQAPVSGSLRSGHPDLAATVVRAPKGPTD